MTPTSAIVTGASVDECLRAADSAMVTSERIGHIRRAARCAMYSGDARADEVVGMLLRIAAVSGDDEDYASALFFRYWVQADGRAIDRLERAVALGAERVGWAARAAACLATLRGDYSVAMRHDERAIELARERGDALLEALATEKLALACSWTGNVPRAIALYRAAIEQMRALQMSGWALLASNNLADILADDLQMTAAIEESGTALELAHEADPALLPRMQAQHAAMLWKAGMLDAAAGHAADAAAAVEPGHHTSAVIAIIASWVAIDSGTDSQALEAAHRALVLAEENGCESFVFEARFARARALHRSGRVEDAVTACAGLTIDEPTSMLALGLWAARIWAACSDERFRSLAARAREAAGQPGCAYGDLALAEIAVLLSEPDDRPEPIAERWLRAGRALEAGRARAAAALLRGDVDEITRACRELMRLGIRGREVDSLAARARAAGRPVSPASSGRAAGLTQRQLEVATLAAAGMTNAQIARRLHVSPETVKRHMSDVFRELAISARSQLAAHV